VTPPGKISILGFVCRILAKVKNLGKPSEIRFFHVQILTSLLEREEGGFWGDFVRQKEMETHLKVRMDPLPQVPQPKSYPTLLRNIHRY
jgi:hypothetical protein